MHTVMTMLTRCRGLIHCFTNYFTFEFGAWQTNNARAIDMADKASHVITDICYLMGYDRIGWDGDDVRTWPLRVMPSTPPVAVCSVAAMTASFVMRAR